MDVMGGFFFLVLKHGQYIWVLRDRCIFWCWLGCIFGFAFGSLLNDACMELWWWIHSFISSRYARIPSNCSLLYTFAGGVLQSCVYSKRYR